MTVHWVTAPKIFDGERLHADAAVRIEDDHLAAVDRVTYLPYGARPTRVGELITPGFFDIQVNVGGGVLFNSTPTPEGLRVIAATHKRFGTGAILPTVITDAPGVVEAAADAEIKAHGRDGIMALHMEGPHISVARKGSHGATHIRPLDAHTFSVVEGVRRARVPVLITLAPEAVAKVQIAQLNAPGVVVAIGHSDSTFDKVRAAEAEGVQLFTHLFNVMSPMLNRASGVTGAAITSEAYCSVICDGIHATREMLRIAMAARPVPDRMILISDAMPTVGGPGWLDLYGHTIHVQDGQLVNAEGTPAGAHITIAQSLALVAENLGVSLESALRIAITNPARLMGLGDRFMLEGKPVGDFCMFDRGWRLVTCLGGKRAD